MAPGADVERFVADAREFARADGDVAGWAASVRREGLERFRSLGWPTPDREAWRFTDVRDLLRAGLSFAAQGASRGPAGDPAAGAACTFRIDGEDGRAASPTAPAGVRIGTLLSGAADGVGGIGRIADDGENPFAALNAAFLGDGASVSVAAGTRVAGPIRLEFGAPRARTHWHPRAWIDLAAGSQATVVEIWETGEGPHLANAVTEIRVGPGASLDHVRIVREGAQGTHVGTVQAHVARDGRARLHSVVLGGGLVRVDVRAVLAGEGASCVLNGLYRVDHEAHIDHHTFIDHASPHGTSEELYKGVLSGRGHAVFEGRIRVREGARRTDARQSNRNLVLSPDAWVKTNPQLEILADDVKCAHGATIGQLDEDALFYLRARGVPEGEARDLLVAAFVQEMLARLPVGAPRARLCALAVPGAVPDPAWEEGT